MCHGNAKNIIKWLISFAALLCGLMISTAYPEEIMWTCPNCDRTNNTGRYCGNCGQMKTERLYYLNSNPEVDHGRVTVSWTDTENRQPYTVEYMYRDPDTLQNLVIIASDVSSNSFTFDTLIPGKTYTIVIRDADDLPIQKNYDLPEPEVFADGALIASSIKAWIEPVYKERSNGWASARSLSALKASDITNNRDIYDYNFMYCLEHGVLPYPREYFTQLMIQSPNGYVTCAFGVELEFGADQRDGLRYINPRLFDRVNERTGTIPAGTWIFELYWDGMIVDRSTFTVQ